jgi:maltooligosyltrehalose trehalohydrolase
MGWDPAVVPDPQDPETFTRSKLNWAEASEGEHARLLELYRALIALRRSTPDLTEPGFEDTVVEVSEDEGWLLLRRGRTEVAMNFSAEARRLPVRGATLALATDGTVRLDPAPGEAPGAEPAPSAEPAANRLGLPGHSAAILTN